MNNNQDIKNNFSQDIESLIKYFLQERLKEKIGGVKFFPGIVVDNNDPDKLGRCKIRVYSKFPNEIPNQDLPWAIPDFNFIGGGLSSFIVPKNGSLIQVYFENDEIYNPHYSTKILDKNALPSERNDDYPDTMVFFETTDGEYFKVNTKTKESTYRHSSGVIFTIQKDGTIEIDSENSLTGNINIKCRTKLTVDAKMIQFPAGSVVPNPSGNGPFVAIPFDTLTGLPQGGSLQIRQSETPLPL